MNNPTRKLKKPPTSSSSSSSSSSKFDLEEIIGLTTTNANGLASSFFDSKFVYIAGCVVVLYDVDLGTQSHLMVSNRTLKPFTSVAVSQDGNYIAAGESGHQPAIVVWSSATLASVSELKGHQYGVACMAFSPDGKHLVSVGFPQDGYLCLWDWRSGRLVKKLKACSSFSAVTSVSFSVDANFILTAGKKHLKIWTVGLPTKSRAKTNSLSLSMHGKTLNLGHHKACTFTAITSSLKTNGNLADGKSGDLVLVYALTDSGVLCLLHGGLTITRSVNLKVEKGYALSASREFVACACNNGEVKLYTVGSLEYAGSLHYSEDKQSNKTANNTQFQSEASQVGIQQPPTFPDAIACQFSTSEKLVVVYRDHSLYIWNIHGKFQATKCCVLVSHSACIWDVQNLPCENMHDPSLACVARGCNGGVSFATCSADGTIRLWDLALQSESQEPAGSSCLVGAGTFERESVVSGVTSQGYRSMAVSSDGKHLAAGDSDGNLHIFNLNTSDYTCIQDVHKAEILSLNFSLPVKKRINSAEEVESYYFLASGGSDRMIQLFDANRNFDLIASVDDHSAAVTAVKLTGNGRKIISCSSDRSLIIRDVAGRGTQYDISHSHQQIASGGTVCDLAIDTTTETVVTVGQDKSINIFNVAAGQVIRSFKQGGDFGDPIKVALDPSCSYLVCSYSDRSICMYDFMSGEMVACGLGHGEAINGIIFLPDCKHLVSVGSDGCIFVWKVPTVLTSRMLQRIKENSCPLSPTTIAPCAAVNQLKFFEENYLRSQRTDRAVVCEGNCPQETSTFKFSVSRLPQWAKSKVTSPLVIPMDPILSEIADREDHSPSKPLSDGNAPVSLQLHTPSNHNTERITQGSSCGTSNSKATQGTCRSFALDRRWLTIHTVCLDLLNSPDVCSTNERIVPLSSDPSHGHASEATNIESMNIGQAECLNVHTGMNDSGCLSHDIDPHQLNETSDSREEFTHGDSEPLQLSTSVNQVADKCILNSGNNSANSKTEAPKSSSRKSYSARFTVRRDLLRGQKLPLDLPMNDTCEAMNRCKETNLTNLMNLSVTEQDDSERGSNSRQGTVSSNSTLNLLSKNHIASQSNSCSSSAKPTEAETMPIKDQQDCEIIKHKTLDACKEALRSLADSSKTALEVFSKLKDAMSTHGNPEGPETEFYAEAAQMLPSIAKNVHEIAKFATSCGDEKVDIPGFEPLLGKFAESLSQRVIQLLKENCTSL